METTIQVSQDLRNTLSMMKTGVKESYEDLIWDLIEDTKELSEETKRELALARLEVKEGKVHKWADVKKELGINV
jgi:predicted CopG family antitoxin